MKGPDARESGRASPFRSFLDAFSSVSRAGRLRRKSSVSGVRRRSRPQRWRPLNALHTIEAVTKPAPLEPHRSTVDRLTTAKEWMEMAMGSRVSRTVEYEG